MSVLASLALSLFAGGSTPAPAALAGKVTVKFATVVPEGSVWDKSFRRMGSEWKKGTDERVKMKLYAGGIAGDEPDIIRKLRIRQLNAAALTISGLTELEPAFGIFQAPMFFRSHEEMLYVLGEMTPMLDKRLEQKGLVRLHWAHAGWIHLFSKKPVKAPDDLRKQKQFVWAGNSAEAELWKSNGFRPVPLSASDIPQGLQTGLIEAVPAPPMQALALQWFRTTPYMLDLGAVPFLGGTVIAKKTWDKISKEDQALMLAAGKRAEEYLAVEVPKQEREAIEEMKKRGLKVLAPANDGAEWQKLADKFASELRATERIPKDVFDRAKELRDAYRAK